MKHIFAIILSIMLLTACGESERVQFGQLQQIDSIAEVNADSAIVLLNAINRDSLSSNDNKYYFDLLQIRASDKAYIAHTSDSAILSVINYFENHDFNNLLPIAYYYGGRVYSDLGDAPQALEYFQKALDCESTNTNLLLNGKISSQMGQLMIKTRLYHQAKYKFKEAISYNIKSNDSLALMFNYSNLGSAYKWVEKPDSSIYFIKKAIDIATQKNINNEYKMLMHCHIASVYAYKKDFIRAKIELEKCISFFYTPKNQIYAYCIACNIYSNLDDLTNARIYAEKIIKHDPNNRVAHGVFVSIAKKTNKSNLLYPHLDQYLSCIDSLNKSTTKEAIITFNILIIT